MTLHEEEKARHDEGERKSLNSPDQKHPRLPLVARLGIAAYGLSIVAASLAPEQWMSELVWALLFVGCVLWELVGVKREQKWRQEPLTHIYADRLMKLEKWGWMFRVAWLSLFSWWMVHWITRVPW